MKERNYYKGIVWFLAICALAAALAGQARAYGKTRERCGICIQTEGALANDTAKQLRRLKGILRFEPFDTARVTIRLREYVLETELAGVDLECYPLRYQCAQDTVTICNTPQLLFGKDMFSMFADQNGRAPGASQIQAWIGQYRSLELVVTDENGRERKAKVCGILKSPADMVCMEKGQMEELFGKFARPSGGFLEIRGRANMEKARKLLEEAGFAVR